MYRSALNSGYIAGGTVYGLLPGKTTKQYYIIGQVGPGKIGNVPCKIINPCMFVPKIGREIDTAGVIWVKIKENQ